MWNKAIFLLYATLCGCLKSVTHTLLCNVFFFYKTCKIPTLSCFGGFLLLTIVIAHGPSEPRQLYFWAMMHSIWPYLAIKTLERPGKKAGCMISALFYPKGVQWGWDQNFVQAQVLPHQLWQTMFLWSLLFTQGQCNTGTCLSKAHIRVSWLEVNIFIAT